MQVVDDILEALMLTDLLNDLGNRVYTYVSDTAPDRQTVVSETY